METCPGMKKSHYADGIAEKVQGRQARALEIGNEDSLMAPHIPPIPRRIKKPYLFDVTNDVMRLKTPRRKNPASKMI